MAEDVFEVMDKNEILQLTTEEIGPLQKTLESLQNEGIGFARHNNLNSFSKKDLTEAWKSAEDKKKFFRDFFNDLPQDINIKPCVYVFQLSKSTMQNCMHDSHCLNQLQCLHKTFFNYKEEQTRIKYDSKKNGTLDTSENTPGVNKDRSAFKPANAIYVGKVNKKIKDRLSDHIGRASRTTFALKLEKWLPENIKIKVTIYSFPESFRNAPLALIEKAMWKKYNPIIGEI